MSYILENSPFGIDVGGQLKLKEKLDYENMSNTHINVTVEAIDTANHTVFCATLYSA